MNKTDQQKNNKYIDYWKKSGIESKKVNQSNKIEVTTTFRGKDGLMYERVTFRHPTLKDIKLAIPEKVKPSTKSKEQYKIEKQEKLNNRSYSEKHNELVASLYMKKDVFKQQALIAAHESKIANILSLKNFYKMRKLRDTKGNKPHVVIVKRTGSDWKPYDFSTITSFKPLEELWKEVREMADKLSVSMRNFAGIEIWERDEYLQKDKNPSASYRYHAYPDKSLKQAA